MLDTQYAGYVDNPGWCKRWFFADVPGWHILQYYCSGWSNYAYIYVHGPGNWVNPIPNPEPTPYPIPPENPDKKKCEENFLCNWVNDQCLCTGFTPDDHQRERCELNPNCNWINGQCLCTGFDISIESTNANQLLGDAQTSAATN
ncbi:MAG: hypothetical protein MUO26_02020 [Methanotrichaceae archaeon]|nr:hypothetical protein [Methanotrichaceae archaeon]